MGDAPSTAGLATPVVVRGAHDHLCPPGWAEHLAAGGPVVTLPGGHDFVWTRPDLSSDVLRAAAR